MPEFQSYHRIAKHVFNRPHMVEPNYATTFVGALTERLNVRSLITPEGERLMAAELKEQAARYERTRDRTNTVDVYDGIAVVPVAGTLVHRYGHLEPFSGMTGYDGIQAKIAAAADDPSIRGVLLDINSPGGEASGVFDLSDFIFEAREAKPVWALIDEFGASAAYAIASAANRIVLPRTAMAGSIGVLTMHVDVSQMLEKAGIDVTLLFSGARKVDGNPYEPLSEEARSDIQTELDVLYDLFVETVARNREVSADDVRGTEARMFRGREAVGLGLADEVMPARNVLGTFDEFLRTGRLDGGPSMKRYLAMPFSLFKRGGKSDEEERTDKLEARTEEEETEEQVESAPEPEAEKAEGEDTEGQEQDEPRAEDEPEPEPEPQQEAASAEHILAACMEANVPAIAHGLLKSGATVEQVNERISNAHALRDVFSAAGFPDLAEAAIRENVSADFCRELMREVTAQASGEEVDHRTGLKEAGEGRPGLNVVKLINRDRKK